MIYNALFVAVGIIAFVVGIMFHHLWSIDKYITDIEWHRFDDLGKLAAVEQRVRVLEEQMSGLLKNEEDDT